ncbi:hypothetical protein AAF695_09955, partial [Aerococcus viridans]|uniref:hypothetical protein n=1 Tax=Aerococcus urinaeequi TaxID=51665 RepID=UPI00288DE2EA
SLKTLYRKRTVIWPFYFYTIIRTLSQSPFAELKMTDEYDNLILTTKGFFLDDVPNQIWLKNELMPALTNLQI